MPWQSENHAVISNNTILMRVISVITIIALIFNYSLSYAFPNQTVFGTKSHAQRFVKSETEKNLADVKDNPGAIAIPAAYGQIAESFSGEGDTLVVHIQDCHVDEVAQLNIARILKVLAENYGIRLICLEGASKKLDTSFYNAFPDGEIKEKASRFFVKKALFTGAEYFNIANRGLGISAFGVENKNLYLDHLKAYQDVRPDKEKTISYLSRLETHLDKIKSYVYSKPLTELELKNKEYQDKRLTLAEYSLYLTRAAERLKVEPDCYPDLRKFITLAKREKRIDFKKAEQQRQKLIEELSQRLKEKELKELLNLSLDFRLNNISAVCFYGHLQDLAERADYRIRPRDYGQLISYIEYLKISGSINYIKLFDEIESLNEEIASGLFKDQIQKTVFQFSRNLAMLKDLYSLKLTHKKLNCIDSNPSEFDIGRIAAFIKNTSAALGVPVNFNENLFDLDAQGLKATQRFYRIATERDIAIVKNTLKRMPSSSNKAAVLITGGFHTSGITNILREKGVSYVVICPIIGMGNCEKLYADRIKGIIPGYVDILQVASQTLVPALATGGIADGLRIKTAFSIAFASLLQSEGLRRILDSNEQGLTLPAIGDGRPLRLEEAVEMIRAVVDAKGSVKTEAPLRIASLTTTALPEQSAVETGVKAASAGEKGKEQFSVKKMLATAVVTAAVGSLTHFGVVVKLDEDPASDTKQMKAILRDDPSDTRTPKRTSRVSGEPKPTVLLKKPRTATNVKPPETAKLSSSRGQAPKIDVTSQQIPQPPGAPHRAGLQIASLKPQQLPLASSAKPNAPLATPGATASRLQEALTVSQTIPAGIFQPGQGFTVHPAVFIAEESLSSEEQIKNYEAAYKRVQRIVELVFGDKISEEQKRCWRLLLLGTEATETNFLDKYSGVTPNGNGRYQITGSTAYGIIHSYVTFPVKIKTKDGKIIYRTGVRKELVPLFEKATNNKVSWDVVEKMNKAQLRELLAADDDFSCLVSLLVYKEVLKQEGIKEISSDPETLAMLWKQYYNTVFGDGTIGRFVERFGLIHKRPSELLEVLCRKTKTEYKKLFFQRGLGADCLKEEAQKRYSQFKEENGLDKDFSKRAVTLLRDEYGITPSNIYSMITPFEAMLDNKLMYARFKNDELVHIIIYREHGRLNVRLVVCRDVSQWATEKEKAMADITIYNKDELYNALANPFQKKTDARGREGMQQGAGVMTERIPTLSMQKTIEAATVNPAVSLKIIKGGTPAGEVKLSSEGGLILMSEGHPEGINGLLKDKRRHEEISNQA